MKHSVGIGSYAEVALPHLDSLLKKNASVLKHLVGQIVSDVQKGRSLFVFGSGHSSTFAFELYHRAGGASFVIPIVGDYLLPSAGSSVVRVLERTAGLATPLLERAMPQPGEMLWLASQSGINAAVVDLAIEARKKKMKTVAFTSVIHSRSVNSRHASGKRLYEVSDHVVDLGGRPGDASVPIRRGLSAGPLSTLGSVFLGNSILVAALAQLESMGVRCVYTSVNTASGEARNRELEVVAKQRDYLLR